MAIEGRWTLQRCAGCGRVAMGRSPEEECPDTERMEAQKPVPVVPCDDAAVERVAARLFAESFTNPVAEVIPALWNQSGQESRAFYVGLAEAVLRAAGGQDAS